MKNTVNLIEAAKTHFGTTVLSRNQLRELVTTIVGSKKGIPGYVWQNKVARGRFDVADPNQITDKHTVVSYTGYNNETHNSTIESDNTMTQTTKAVEINYIPNKSSTYVPCKNYTLFRNIIKSKKFYPVYITGESGVGKTFSIMQACATEKREALRVNFTSETSERDLIGGMRLSVQNGVSVTSWTDGPVLTAMKRGAILILDEVDLGTDKTMCLQSVMEGNPYINKQTGEVVHAQEGFNIFATANTKGQLAGRSNKFVGTRVQNEAFLDRFSITVTHEAENIEKILLSHAQAEFNGEELSDEVKYLVEDLATWTIKTHDSYVRQDTSNFITPRRVADVLKGYFILGNVDHALKYALARFTDDETRAYLNLWSVIKKDRSAKIEGFNDSAEKAAAEKASSESNVESVDNMDEFVKIVKNVMASA